MVLTPATDARKDLQMRFLASSPQYFEGYWTWSFDAMGTRNQLIFKQANPEQCKSLIEDLTEWLIDFELRYSRFISSSLVCRINAQAGGDPLPLEARDEELFALCDWFYWRTKGIFDPTSGSLLTHWDYQRSAATLPSPEDLEKSREAVGWSHVERSSDSFRLPHPGMKLDLGGIGKEYAVDQTANKLEAAGIHSYMISFGRDIRCAGHAPGENSWRIGLEHPRIPDQCWAGVGLNKGSIAASGQSKRFLEIEGQTYGHLLDVRTCKPAQNNTQASWAIAPTCTEAGIMASAACILGFPEGLNLLETTTQTAGCLWSGTNIHQTRRFNRYVLEDHSPRS